MKIGIVGFGSIGKRHARNCRFAGHEFAVHDPAIESSEPLNELIDWCDAVIVASPTNLHAEHAVVAMRRGKPVLIEKPAAMNGHQAQKLLECQQTHGTLAFVGYNWRFDDRLRSAITCASLYGYRAWATFSHDLRQWRQGADWKSGYAVNAETGGGILLDASHEIDSLIQAFGRPTRVAGAALRMQDFLGCGNVEAAASATLVFDGKRVAQLHLDCLSSSYEREFGYATTFENGAERRIFIGRHETDRIDQTYQRELMSFAAIVSGSSTPPEILPATLAESLPVLQTIDAIKRSARIGQFAEPGGF